MAGEDLSRPSGQPVPLWWPTRLGSFLLAPIREVIWLFYVGAILLLPTLVRSEKRGQVPRGPCLFCVTHVGNFDPLFVVRQSRLWRMKAVYQVDKPYPLVRFLYRSFWRFRVTQDPGLKPILNPRTVAEVVRYLRRGGRVMIYPEGYRCWERRLYPGVAVIAHRAGVPIVPVGIENGYTLRPERETEPLFRVVRQVIRDYRRLGRVTVHFGGPIFPDPSRAEAEDVPRLMRAVETAFQDFYRRFYGLPGPVWAPPDVRWP
ncbi:1-acyl-sn-glycerol-3-phosphate acyltransferase [Candidatus Bipolaricaulota bacterium]|nr:1-acyl-sn-glycerol-3-phosphate acyltransferase [Candidatus Bipolaricaulota bacterium]